MSHHQAHAFSKYFDWKQPPKSTDKKEAYAEATTRGAV